MGKNLVETVIGAVVLIIAGSFFGFAYVTADVATVEGYDVTARFNKVDGLPNGSDVRLAGVKIGAISDTRLDFESYQAVITMNINHQIKLPTDTVASITSDGLLGSKYIRLVPGQATDRIAPGGEIGKTVDGAAIEEIVARMIFLATEN